MGGDGGDGMTNTGQDAFGTRGASESVRAPGFGETGAPTPPAASIPEPTVSVAAAEHVAAPAGASGGHRSSDSNAAIVAVLVFAALVIVGGALALVTTDIGSFGTSDADEANSLETVGARTDDAATGSARDDGTGADSSVEAASQPVETAPTSNDVDEPKATTTAPPVTATPTTAPPTTVPPSTAPPTTAAPVAAIDPATGRGFGDLGLGQAVLAEPCNDTYVTFVVGIAGGDRPYPEQVQRGLSAFPGSNYIWGGMCPSLRQFNDSGDEIYGVVFGPYGSAQEACDVQRRFAGEGAYVRRLNLTDPIGRDDHCG